MKLITSRNHDIPQFDSQSRFSTTLRQHCFSFHCFVNRSMMRSTSSRESIWLIRIFTKLQRKSKRASGVTRCARKCQRHPSRSKGLDVERCGKSSYVIQSIGQDRVVKWKWSAGLDIIIWAHYYLCFLLHFITLFDWSKRWVKIEMDLDYWWAALVSDAGWKHVMLRSLEWGGLPPLLSPNVKCLCQEHRKSWTTSASL